jgi:prevent-host-death family protein
MVPAAKLDVIMHMLLYSLKLNMPIATRDIIALTQARATLSELADEVKLGAEKIITKNGESYVALIDAARLDHYHHLERAQIHLLLLQEAERGLADIAAGRVTNARAALAKLKKRRTVAR